METKQILQMVLGTLSMLLGVLVTRIPEATVDAIASLLIAFLLMLMAGFLWIGTAVSILK